MWWRRRLKEVGGLYILLSYSYVCSQRSLAPPSKVTLSSNVTIPSKVTLPPKVTPPSRVTLESKTGPGNAQAPEEVENI